METTIAEIREMTDFERVKLIAGEHGVNRKVRNVYFMEVPDIFDYIDEGGFLLSTLYPIADDEKAISELIPKLVAIGMAGLAIKPARYITDIPEIMIEQANQYDFPLFVLSQEANLSTLTNTILERLLDKNTTTLQFRNDLHNKMMEELVNGASQKELTETVSEMIHTPIVLVDRQLDRITDTLGEKVTVDHSAMPPVQIHQRTCFSKETLNQVLLLTEAQERSLKSCYVQPVLAGEECFGYMILLKEPKEVDDNERIALEQTSLLMASVFQRDKAIKQKEENYLDSFIRDVLNENMASQFEVIEKAKMFKWDLQFPVALFNLNIRAKDAEVKQRQLIQLLETKVIEQFLSRKLDIQMAKIKLIYLDDAIYGFVNVAFESNISKRLLDVSRQLAEDLAAPALGYTVSIGIADAADSLKRLPVAYREARKTRELAERLAGADSCVEHYSDMILYELMDQVPEDVMQTFLEGRIGNVLAYDEKKRMDLLETLEAFIEHDFNAQRAAASLFIHYNTFRYRLDKLKELGIDYDNGFDWMETALACRMLKMTNHHNTVSSS